MIKTAITENGWVRGVSAADPRIIAYKGIPFAAPPVGELRWKAPQPAHNWEGTLDCLEFAPISMQAKPGLDENNIYTREWNVDPEIPMSEDCLYLNVWTPAKTPDEKLPVFVWFFGGALKEGNPAEMEFDGERIARRGIVVVTVNYRVNVFGFLCHPEITKEAPEAPANFGNLDQQYGLFWTKRNIAAFGGDPNNITIGGQSAGGASVLNQLVCPTNKGYIQKGIVESGVILNTYFAFRTRQVIADAEKDGEKFFELLGVKTLAEARSLSAEYVRDKYLECPIRWGTIVDGKFQPDTYMNTLAKGEFPDLPMMMGHTKNEFLMRPPVNSIPELQAYAENMFGADAKRFVELIGADKGIEHALASAEVNGIEYSLRAVFRIMDKLGMKASRYYYEFDAEIPGWDAPGSFHSSDLWFWFETLAKCWRPFTGRHYDLARQMCNYWANFIRCSDPNGDDADGMPMETWAPYTEQNPVKMTLYDQPKAQLSPNDEFYEILVKAKENYQD